MRVRALDANKDWTYGKGANDYLQGNAAIAQNINTRLSSWLGNCFFDLNAGINWPGLMGQKNQLNLNLAISTMILNTEGVTGILQLSTNLTPTRQFTVTYQVQTIYSTSTSTFTFDTVIG